MLLLNLLLQERIPSLLQRLNRYLRRAPAQPTTKGTIKIIRRRITQIHLRGHLNLQKSKDLITLKRLRILQSLPVNLLQKESSKVLLASMFNTCVLSDIKWRHYLSA